MCKIYPKKGEDRDTEKMKIEKCSLSKSVDYTMLNIPTV